MKIEFRYGSLKSKLRVILFVCNLMIEKLYKKVVLNRRKRSPAGIRFNPGLLLTNLSTTAWAPAMSFAFVHWVYKLKRP